jgi:hypothetical protein
MRAIVFAAAALAACVMAGSVSADGLPVLGIDVGSEGVTVAGSSVRYVTVGESGSTLIERIARNGGRVRGLARVTGTFTIPAVAYDASASGLSADGSTLVLIEPRTSFPRRVTTFALLDARRLHLKRTIRLRGDFSFDAISPDGRTIFLINYSSPADPTRYSVRAYDLRANTLLPNPVRDPAERSAAMRGSPITRVVSTDGRWAYTLYDGAGGTPFVHALDTRMLRAHCIDLSMLAGRNDLWSLRFTRGPNAQLRIGTSVEVLATVDTSSFAANVPVVRTPAGVGRWLILGGAVLAALALAALSATRRRVRGREAPA